MYRKKLSVGILSEHDRGWLAALIDGEGSISIPKPSPEKMVPAYPGITIHNTNREILERARLLCDGSLYLRTDINHLGKKPGYIMSTNRVANVDNLLKQLLPSLIVKRERAIEAIEAIDEHKKSLRKPVAWNRGIPISEWGSPAQLKALAKTHIKGLPHFERRKPRTILNCNMCGREFYLLPTAVLKKGRGKFCSRKCLGLSRRGKVPEWMNNLEKRAAYLQKLKVHLNDPLIRKKYSDQFLRLWRNSEFREKQRVSRSKFYGHEVMLNEPAKNM